MMKKKVNKATKIMKKMMTKMSKSLTRKTFNKR